MLDEKDIITTKAVFDFEEASRDSDRQQSRDDDAISIRAEALGDDLPKDYFYSVGFLGALAVSRLASLDDPLRC